MLLEQKTISPLEIEESFYEPSPLTRLTDKEMVNIIACPGFLSHFDMESLFWEGFYPFVYNEEAEGYQSVKTGKIRDKNGIEYLVLVQRDLDNCGILIVDNQGILYLRLNLRDRRFDGMPEATSPYFLKEIGGMTSSEIPERSKYIGGTNWYYSSPRWDRQVEGRRSVEFSIYAADPNLLLADCLKNKEGNLFVDPDKLTKFIRDPFKFIPFADPNKENLSEWYTLWWQVVNRGLRGKKIPYPGQASQQGFKGFFNHAVKETRKVLGKIEFTHLSGVPTWYYIWGLNLSAGFQPDNQFLAQETERFFNALERVELPDFAKTYKGEKVNVLGDIDRRDPLFSWYAVLPFALELNPQVNPNISLQVISGDSFNETFEKAKAGFYDGKGVITYPLRPGRNIWHSIETTVED